MAEATPINLRAFAPFGGGRGARLSVTAVSAAVAVPGLGGGQGSENTRVVVSNSGSVAAYVVFGQSGVVATTGCYEILPGTKETLTPPFNGSGGSSLYIAAITESGATGISACAGEGT